MKKSVLVTGSAKRIGRRLALDFAKDGWDVAVHCNSSITEAEEVAGFIRAMGRNTVIVRGNLSEADVPDRLIAEASAAPPQKKQKTVEEEWADAEELLGLT